jgi:hypothetical protein
MDFSKLISYIPYAKDAGFLMVHVAGLALLAEGDATGAAKKQEVVTQIRTEMAKPGGFDLPKAFDSDFTVGLAVDVALKLLNLVGFSAFFAKLKTGSAPT